MICITCGLDFQLSGPGGLCPECGAHVGLTAQGRGFLPQLEALEQQLANQEIEREEGDVRLNRFEDALQAMLGYIDLTCDKLFNTHLDELQQATVTGFLQPLRNAIKASQELAREVPVEAPWPGEIWDRLRASQAEMTRGFHILFLLTRALGANQWAAVDWEALRRTVEQTP